MSVGNGVVSCGQTDRRDEADRRLEDDHLVVETSSRPSIEHNKLVFFMVIGICFVLHHSLYTY